MQQLVGKEEIGSKAGEGVSEVSHKQFLDNVSIQPVIFDLQFERSHTT